MQKLWCTWWAVGGVFTALGPAGKACQAQHLSWHGIAGRMNKLIDVYSCPLCWQGSALKVGLAVLAGAGVAAAWRWRELMLQRQKRQLELAIERRTEDLEREKAELLRAREQMRHYAEHDGLTGLWNHRIILERLRGEVDRSRREGTPLSVVLADLDHFKWINDTHGHQTGDMVLKEIGAIFLRSVRSYDWVGRYGGEEFLLILPGTSFTHARTRAEQLRQAVQTARIGNGKEAIQLTASIGVASGFPADYEAIIRAADAALYRAKSNGRNCIVVTEIAPPSDSGSPK